MIPAIDDLTETTKMLRRLDALDDALEDLRVMGSLLLHETYAAPWAIAIPHESQLRKLVGADTDTRVLIFHFVRRGGFEMRIDGCDPVSVDAAEVAVCSGGVAHTMCSGASEKITPLEAILRGNGPASAPSEAVDQTELVCGLFLVRAAPLNPLFGALPSVVKVATDDASFSPMLAGVAWMLAHELDRGALGTFATARLVEMFCAEAIRVYQRKAGADYTGWFSGLADPRISESIRRVHEEPSYEWTVEALADIVALSPSRFAARFRELTGQSAMQYVARWRANVACRLLGDTDLQLSEIAERVGYGSLPAFSRAFKAHLGRAPADWRATHSKTRRHATRPLIDTTLG